MATIGLATRLLGTLNVSSNRDFSEEIIKILDNANTKTQYTIHQEILQHQEPHKVIYRVSPG